MKIEISRTTPEDQQEWRKNLFLISSLPTRFLGIIPEDQVERAREGKPFRLLKAAVYFCNISLQQSPRGVSLSTLPHTLLKYDLIETLEVLDVVQCQHVVRVSDQGPTFQEWMYKQYLELFDPAKVAAPEPKIIGG